MLLVANEHRKKVNENYTCDRTEMDEIGCGKNFIFAFSGFGIKKEFF